MEAVTRAVKLLRTGAEPKDKEDFLREAEVMLKLDHPNLVIHCNALVFGFYIAFR